MKHLHLSLIATACAFALSGCSSGGGNSNNVMQQKSKINEKPATELVQQKGKSTMAEDKPAIEVVQQKGKSVTAENKPVVEVVQQKGSGTTVEPKPTISIVQQKGKSVSAEAKPVIEIVQKKGESLTLPEKSAAELVIPAFDSAELTKTFVNQGVTENNVSKVSGAVLSINKGKVATGENINNPANNLNELVIDNVTIPLFTKELIEKHYDGSEPTTLIGVDGENYSGAVGTMPTRKATDDFNQLRYGLITVNGVNKLFVQGHLTPVGESVDSPYNHFYHVSAPDRTQTLRPMPTTGSYKYNGYALYGKESFDQLNVQAVADMDNKKVKVELKDHTDALKLTLGGKIEGNTFAGSFNGIETKGAFYGSKAWDMGGIFYQTQGEEKDFHGVFGASQGSSWRGNQIEDNSLKDFDLK